MKSYIWKCLIPVLFFTTMISCTPVREVNDSFGKTQNEIDMRAKDDIIEVKDFDKKEQTESIILNEEMKRDVYEALRKEENTLLYEEELKGYEGKIMDSYGGGCLVQSGKELDFLLKYYNLNNVNSLNLEFYQNSGEWEEESYKGLVGIEADIYITGEGEAFPANLLNYLTGVETVHFNLDDIYGDNLKNVIFPVNIKSVHLVGFQSGSYENLFRCMSGSGVSHLYVLGTNDSRLLLDQICGMEYLEYLSMSNGSVCVDDEELLRNSNLRNMEFNLYSDTDISFVNHLDKMKNIDAWVIDDCSFSELIRDKGLDIRLKFDKNRNDERAYGDLYDSINMDGIEWKEGEFLIGYQRRYDMGRTIECYTMNSITNPESELEYSSCIRTVFRVDNMGVITFLYPEEEAAAMEFGFGMYRGNCFSMQDINFDGYQDIVMDTGRYGNQDAVREFAWLWNEEEQNYISAPTYFEIMNPAIDAEEEIVRGSWRSGAASHGWEIYKCENNQFVLKSILKESVLNGGDIPKDSEVWEWVEEEVVNGEIIEIQRFTVTKNGSDTEYPDAWYEFYEPGSYWG